MKVFSKLSLKELDERKSFLSKNNILVAKIKAIFDLIDSFNVYYIYFILTFIIKYIRTRYNNIIQMERINANIELIKKDVISIIDSDESLSKLTLKELDEILNFKFMLYNTPWDKKKEETQSIKDKYISTLIDELAKIKAILYWNDSGGWIKTTDIGVYKQHIVDYINNVVIGEDSKSICKSISEYDMAWKIIKDNGIVLTPSDIKTLNIQFLNYVMSRQRYSNPFRSYIKPENCGYDSDEDDISKKKTQMTTLEHFWINVLASKRDDINKDDVMICLGTDVDQRLRFMPNKVTIFEEGDILPQIVQHYKDSNISPMIKYRRNVGILLENKPYDFYNYSEYMASGPFLSTMFTIEFPYMCYVYVDKIEVDIRDGFNILIDSNDSNISKKEKNIISYMTVGSDNIQCSFRSVKEDRTENNNYISNIKTLSKICDDKKPGYYLTVSFGWMTSYQKVVNIRVYGKAISLI